MAKTKSKTFPKITTLPQSTFDEYCYQHILDDTTVDGTTDSAFISIIGTPDCLKYWLDEENTKHWFNRNHTNVLNLEFDDLTEDREWEGHVFKAMTDEQADQVITFVENLIREANVLGETYKRNFYIHCRAGFSRSAAISRFLKDVYKDYFTSEFDTIPETWNRGVYRKLINAYERKHKDDD